MDKIIRHVKKEDIPELKRLFREIFGDDVEYIDLFFSKKVKTEKSYICEADNEICGMAYAVDYSLLINGKIYKSAYICGVGTIPKYRKNGVMSSILRQIENEFTKLGYSYLMLIPADERLYHMYERFGFEVAFYRQKDTFIFQDNSRNSECCEIKNAQRVFECYEKVMKNIKKHVTLKKEDYEASLKAYCGEKAVRQCITDEKENITAFAIGYKEDEKLNIRELLYENEKEKQKMLEALCVKYSIKQIEYQHPAETKSVPVGMAKALNGVQRFWDNDTSAYMNMMLD